MKTVQYILTFFYLFILTNIDTELHFWSVCYQNGGIFDLWREANLEIKPEFEDKGDFLPDLVQFCWEVKVKYLISYTYNNNANSITKIVQAKRVYDKHHSTQRRA